MMLVRAEHVQAGDVVTGAHSGRLTKPGWAVQRFDGNSAFGEVILRNMVGAEIWAGHRGDMVKVERALPSPIVEALTPDEIRESER